MPPVVVDNARPSTLADVIGQVREAFAAMGDATPILVGKAYLPMGVGSGPRVVFVPEPSGRIGEGIELGDACTVVHSCDVHVRATESGEDLDRFQAAYALGDRVLALLAVAAAGRIEWGAFVDDSPADVDAFGADLSYSFSYARAVRHDAARWTLPASDADTSDATPGVPPGQLGTIGSVAATTTPSEGA